MNRPSLELVTFLLIVTEVEMFEDAAGLKCMGKLNVTEIACDTTLFNGIDLNTVYSLYKP